MTETDPPLLVVASVEDAPLILDLAERFHFEDGHPLKDKGRRAIVRLLDLPEAGLIFKIMRDRVVAGYAVMCFGYSIEWGGRDALLDDLYVVPEKRDKGLGAQVLTALREVARAQDCMALHLEVVAGNRVEALYRRHGFTDRGTSFLSQAVGVPVAG